MKKIVLFFGWAIFSMLTITANVLVIMAFLTKSSIPSLLIPQQKVSIATPVDVVSPPAHDILGIQTTIEQEDARIPIVSNFLERHSSPLEPYDEWGKKLVDIADKYGIDFRLLPAIAMQESNICKKIPEGTYNCLGFGIHERGTLGFDNYEAGFDRAARELQRNYISQGRTTPEQIMRKYTPSSETWDDSVNQWIAEMKYDDREKGRELKTNADITEYLVSPSPTASPPTESTEASN
jgi:hypothetical protein